MVVVSGEWSDLEKRYPMPSAQEGVVVSHPDLTYLSLGWGVQSWTLAAMVALGELPPVDLAIHADTTHEAAGTYAHAAKWTPWLEERGVKVVTVTADNTEVVREWSGSPVRDDSGVNSGRGRLPRANQTAMHPRLEVGAHPPLPAAVGSQSKAGGCGVLAGYFPGRVEPDAG